MVTIDSLNIPISANANKANTAIDKLVDKLDKLSGALSRINGSGLIGLSNGVQRLSNAMLSMNNVKTTDFTRLAKNIEKLGAINVANLNSAASSMSHLTRAFNNLGTVSANAQQVGELANNLSKLGYKSITNAVQNIPHLATALKELMTTLSTAPRVSQNVINMTNALANLAAQGRYVGTATNSLVGGLNRYTTASTRASKSTFSLAAAFGKFYATYWLIIRGIKGLYKSIESTADYIEAFNYYNVAFDKVAANWSQDYEKYGYENAEAYADSFTDRMDETFKKLSGVKVEVDTEGKGLLSETGLKNLGLNIQEVTQFAAQLASVTNSVGLTGEASLAAADSFTRLAGDISSLFNIDYSSAAQNLQSGLIGQSRALYKYGIDITNATLQTYAYNLGLSKTVTEMTQAEKMQLRMLAILDQSKVAWGDLARTIESPSNQIRMLKNNLSELAQVFGQLFMPILGKILPVLNAVTIALKRLIGSIAGFFGIKIDLESSGQALNDIDTGIEDVSDGLDGVAESAKKAKAGLRGFDELKTINMPETSGADGGAGGIVDLTDEILAATAEYNKVFDEWYRQMQQKAEAIADKIEEFFKPLKDMFRNLSIGQWEQAGGNFSEFISNIFNGLADAIDSVPWHELGNRIGDFIRGIEITDIIASFLHLIGEIKKALRELWLGLFEAAPLETALLTTMALIKWNPIAQYFANKLKSALLGKIDSVLTPFKVGLASKLQTVLGLVFEGFTLKGSMEAVFGTLGTRIAGIGTFLGGLGLAFSNFMKMWNDGWSVMGEILKDLGLAIAAVGAVMLGIVSGPVAAVIAGIVALGSTIAIWAHDNGDTLAIWGNAFKEYGKTALEAFNSLGEGVGYVVDGIDKHLDKAWEDIQVWWIKTKSEWKQGGEQIDADTNAMWQQLQADWHQGWQNISDWWKNSTLVKWWNEDVAPWFTKEKWINVMGGIKEGFEYAWNDAIRAIKDIWNKFASWLNDKLTFNIPSFNFMGATYGGSTIQLGKIPMYYNGGFPESASLFWSGEGGVPELVGTVGGNTAVASGAEITGIRSEIRATANEEMVLLRQQNQLLQALLEKEYGISPDAIFKSVQKSARTYSARTGRHAFGY